MVTVGNVCRRRGSCTQIWPYQSLPYPVLAELEPLAILVWSGGPLPIVTTPHMHLAWWFWHGQVIVYHRLPSPGSGCTPAACDLYQPLPPRRRGQGTDSHIVTGDQHQVAGWHRVIAVDNGAEPRTHSMWVTRWARCQKENLFLNQAGRLVNLYPWW
jgi:hypothetical protein